MKYLCTCLPKCRYGPSQYVPSYMYVGCFYDNYGNREAKTLPH